MLTVVTDIDPAANTALEGSTNSGDAYCTQCEAEGFRRITYYMDRPDILARYSTRITADKAKYPYLLSNGNKVASGDLDDGRHFVQWQDPFPNRATSSPWWRGLRCGTQPLHYQSGRQVALEIFVDKGNLDRAGFAMESLINSMRWDEQRFGLEYDLDIYMIVAVDFFNMGPWRTRAQHLQLQVRAGQPGHCHRCGLPRHRAGDRPRIFPTTGPATASPAATGSS